MNRAIHGMARGWQRPIGLHPRPMGRMSHLGLRVRAATHDPRVTMVTATLATG
jgi:hypothetical protein